MIFPPQITKVLAISKNPGIYVWKKSQMQFTVWKVIEESLMVILGALVSGFYRPGWPQRKGSHSLWDVARDRVLLPLIQPQRLSWFSGKVPDPASHWQHPHLQWSAPMASVTLVKPCSLYKKKTKQFQQKWALFLPEAHIHLGSIGSITAPPSLSWSQTHTSCPLHHPHTGIQRHERPGLQIRKAVNFKYWQLCDIKPMS